MHAHIGRLSLDPASSLLPVLSPSTFVRPYLNETVSARGEARVRIVERPGVWMTEDELGRIVADLQTIVSSSIPAGELAYGAASGDRDRLRASIITLVYDASGKPVAFNALSVMPCELRGESVDVLHLGLVMIDPSHRASGLSGVLYGLTSFLLFARQRMRPL